MKIWIFGIALMLAACAGGPDDRAGLPLAFDDQPGFGSDGRFSMTHKLSSSELDVQLAPGVPYGGCILRASIELGTAAWPDCDPALAVQFDVPNVLLAGLHP